MLKKSHFNDSYHQAIIIFESYNVFLEINVRNRISSITILSLLFLSSDLLS